MRIYLFRKRILFLLCLEMPFHVGVITETDGHTCMYNHLLEDATSVSKRVEDIVKIKN